MINPKVLPDNHDTKIKEGYLPFVSEGYLSLSGDSTQQPVKVNMLRDTGASQSLLLKGVLPLSEQTAVGANVIIRGVECGYVSVPLHKICIKSDLVSGEVTVGVRPTLPVKGVSFLLGNDLAGDKVVVNPVVVNEPCTFDNTEQLQKEIPNIFPACAVTRAMSKKLQCGSQDHQLLEQEYPTPHSLNKGLTRELQKKSSNVESSTEDFVDLSESFLANLNDVQDVESSIPTPSGAGPEQNKSVPSSNELYSDSLSREQNLIEQGENPELVAY